MTRRYYRHVVIEGSDRVPRTGAVLLCANHPNSLMDPIFVGLAAGRGVRFLAKAPLFKIPVLGGLMQAMGMIPAYRGRDDSRQVRKNLETLDTAIKFLQAEDAVGIFPEGLSHDRVGVEMVRSGAARMAFQTVSDKDSNLLVVPIGLNFEDKERFRSDVWIRIGEPIDVRTWMASNDDHEKRMQREFTTQLDQRLKDLTIHLDNPDWEPWFFSIEQIAAPIEVAKPDSNSTTAPLSLQRRTTIARVMNRYIDAEPDASSKLASEIQSLSDKLDHEGISLDAFSRAHNPIISSSIRMFGRGVGFVLLAIPAVLGTIQHVIPFAFVRLLSSKYHSKTNRTDVSFYRLLLSIPAYALTYIATILALSQLSSWSTGLVWGAVAPIMGVIAFEYWPRIRRFFEDVRRYSLATSKSAPMQSARNDLEAIREKLDEIAQDERWKRA